MAEVEGIYLPDDLYYHPKEHIWGKVENGFVRMGMDQLALKASGKIAYIKLLPPGKTVKKNKSFGSVEAGKYVGPLRSLVEGEIVEINEEAVRNPSIVHEDPYGRGYLVVIKAFNLERDLEDLITGEKVQEWLEREVREYREKGLFAE